MQLSLIYTILHILKKMSNFDDVKIFMKTFGQGVSIIPKFPDKKTIQLRYDLIEEELKELKLAFDNKDLLEVTAYISMYGSNDR